jgi:2-keto-3-deoxy-L-rhamnonate aldolase RhmA
MLSKNLRELMRAGHPLAGCTVSGYATEQIEILGLLGFNFAFIDSEHWPLGDRELLHMIAAGDATGMPCLVRVRENKPSVIQRIMDCGAAGVIVPGISDVKDAREVVSAVKYNPIGDRGLSTTRASDYGIKMGLADYVKYANEKSVVVCQIESRESLENAEEITSVDEIDIAFIGTTDLSHSMGFTGQRNNPEVTAAVERIISCAKKNGRAYGAMVRADEDPNDYIRAGYSMIVSSGIGFFSGGAKKFVESFKRIG